MQFAPDVERWRSTVAQYFPANLVDKALWTINYESNGGDPHATGDSGVSIGLFQIQDNQRFAGRPTAAQLLDPTYNIWYAATQLGASKGNWAAWGEGTNGQSGQFGALGDHPYPGDSTGSVATPAAGSAIPVGWPSWLNPSNLPDIPGPFGWKNIPLFPGLPITGGSLPTPSNPLKPITGVTDSLTSIANVFGVIGTGFVWLLDPHHWFRLFAVGAGILLVLSGLYIYVRGTAAVGDVRHVATVASEAA